MTRRRRHGVFGHSAGGQFVHRMISLGFRDDLAAAVTANAGSYAMPTLDVAFPFGLGDTGLTAAALPFAVRVPAERDGRHARRRQQAPNFPREPEAMAQGDTRYARAHAYIAPRTGRSRGTLGVAVRLDDHRCARRRARRQPYVRRRGAHHLRRSARGGLGASGRIALPARAPHTSVRIEEAAPCRTPRRSGGSSTPRSDSFEALSDRIWDNPGDRL